MFVQPAADLTTLRIEGLDKQGSCAAMTLAISNAGINMRGVSSMSAGKNFVAYIGLDSKADAEAAAKILKKFDSPKLSPKRKLART